MADDGDVNQFEQTTLNLPCDRILAGRHQLGFPGDPGSRTVRVQHRELPLNRMWDRGIRDGSFGGSPFLV